MNTKSAGKLILTPVYTPKNHETSKYDFSNLKKKIIRMEIQMTRVKSFPDF